MLFAPRLLPLSGIFSCLNSSGSTFFVPFWGSTSVSAAVTALGDAYTVDDLFEEICQIRGDKADGASTHELVHHIHGEATPDEQVLGCFTRHMLKQLPIWDLYLASTA
jgi:hypothetical protein